MKAGWSELGGRWWSDDAPVPANPPPSIYPGGVSSLCFPTCPPMVNGQLCKESVALPVTGKRVASTCRTQSICRTESIGSNLCILYRLSCRCDQCDKNVPSWENPICAPLIPTKKNGPSSCLPTCPLPVVGLFRSVVAVRLAHWSRRIEDQISVAADGGLAGRGGGTPKGLTPCAVGPRSNSVRNLQPRSQRRKWRCNFSYSSNVPFYVWKTKSFSSLLFIVFLEGTVSSSSPHGYGAPRLSLSRNSSSSSTSGLGPCHLHSSDGPVGMTDQPSMELWKFLSLSKENEQRKRRRRRTCRWAFLLLKAVACFFWRWWRNRLMTLAQQAPKNQNIHGFRGNARSHGRRRCQERGAGLFSAEPVADMKNKKSHEHFESQNLELSDPISRGQLSVQFDKGNVTCWWSHRYCKAPFSRRGKPRSGIVHRRRKTEDRSARPQRAIGGSRRNTDIGKDCSPRHPPFLSPWSIAV